MLRLQPAMDQRMRLTAYLKIRMVSVAHAGQRKADLLGIPQTLCVLECWTFLHNVTKFIFACMHFAESLSSPLVRESRGELCTAQCAVSSVASLVAPALRLAHFSVSTA